MKTRTIATVAVIALASVLSQSCLKSQTDLFDKTASARLTEFTEGAKAMILSSPEGWTMEYFTAVGGYNYAIQFKENGEAVVSDEMHPGTTETSYYKFTNDNGPVLSFDTYNSMLHYFATPSSNEYEALGGDFEFIILGYDDNGIRLKGKRTGRYATLKKLPEGMTVPEYTTKMAGIIRKFLVLGFDCNICGNTEYSGRFDLANRNVIFGKYDQDGVVIGEESSREFVFTEYGVRLYDTLSVNGAVFSKFDVNTDTNEIVPDAPGVTITAKPIPDSYYHFDNYAGDYTLTCGSSRYDVRLEVYDEFNRILNMVGTDTTKLNYEVFLYYDANTGNVTVDAQIAHKGDEACMEDPDSDTVLALIGASSDGHISSYYSMKGVWNKNKSKPVINFETGVETAKVTGFYLWYYDSEGFGDQYNGKKFIPSKLDPLTSLTRK